MARHIRCVNREAAPACSDEQVVYDITAVAGKENTVAVKADKIIDGKRLPMGVLDFTRNPTDGQWSTEFGSPRLHARWSLSTRGNTMTGTMVLLPSNVVVRKIDLQKDKQQKWGHWCQAPFTRPELKSSQKQEFSRRLVEFRSGRSSL